MKRFQDYIKYLRASGYNYFTSEKALGDLHISRNALNCGMYKLRKKGDVISPAKNLYIIVPPEFQSVGSIPPEELIPILMKHWNLPYYISLLSAAMYHGASHQKPQAFQVVTNKQLKSLILGKIKINFIYKKLLAAIPTQTITVKSGLLKIATPEVTAMDLFIYPHHAGGLNHTATVLSELIEALDVEKLLALIRSSKEIRWAQRLGYILEKIDTDNNNKRDKLIKVLKNYISQQEIFFAPLAPELPTVGCQRNIEWKVVENTLIESDI